MLAELGFIIGESPDASEVARAYLALTSGIDVRIIVAATVTRLAGLPTLRSGFY